MGTSNEYDYKPLHLKFYDDNSVEIKAISIDGTLYDATIGLGEEWLKKTDGAEDYTNNPSDYHGEVDVDKNLVKGDGVVIHENSPILDEDDDE